MKTRIASAKRPRRTARAAAAAAIALGVTAVPAAATIIMQNYVEADIQSVAACMNKVAGADASDGSGLVAFDTTNTQATTDGVAVLNETFTIKALRGDHLISSDAGRIVNNCDYPITVSVKAEGQLGDAVKEGDWTGLSARLYLGTAGGTANTDFSAAADWLSSPIHSNGATLPDDYTGTVVLAANGGTARLGWAVDAATDAAATDLAPAILRFTISGQP